MNTRVALIIPCAALLVACGRSPATDRALTPVGPSAVVVDPSGVPAGAVQAMQGRQDVIVNMHDACDPDTFNALPREPGTCVRPVLHSPVDAAGSLEPVIGGRRGALAAAS